MKKFLGVFFILIGLVKLAVAFGLVEVNAKLATVEVDDEKA